jgi:hypothetical protein
LVPFIRRALTVAWKQFCFITEILKVLMLLGLWSTRFQNDKDRLLNNVYAIICSNSMVVFLRISIDHTDRDLNPERLIGKGTVRSYFVLTMCKNISFAALIFQDNTP